MCVGVRGLGGAVVSGLREPMDPLLGPESGTLSCQGTEFSRARARNQILYRAKELNFADSAVSLLLPHLHTSTVLVILYPRVSPGLGREAERGEGGRGRPREAAGGRGRHTFTSTTRVPGIRTAPGNLYTKTVYAETSRRRDAECLYIVPYYTRNKKYKKALALAARGCGTH